MSYINLHTHSEYSNIRVIDSINKLDGVILAAKELGLNGIALTDHETLSGHVKALDFYNNMVKKDESWKNFKLLLGNEIYLTENGRNKDTAEKGQRYPHFILVALDAVGHEQLRELSSRAWDRAFTMYMTRVPTWYSDIEEVIGVNPGHVVATTACIGGLLSANAWQKGDDEKAVELINWAKSNFGDENFFLEMSPAQYDEQKEYNNWLIKMSRLTNTKLTIATDAHFTRPDKREIHFAFLKSKEEERETAEFYQYAYLMTEQEIREFMSYIDQDIITEALSNTNSIGERATNYSLFKEQQIPHLNDDRSTLNWQDTIKLMRVREKFTYINNYLTSENEDDRYMVYLALNKLYNFPSDKKEEALERLNQELEECWEISAKINQPISSYLLTVRNVINLIWDSNSLVGIARGSAGGFILNYLIGITQMNPLEQGTKLPHWRFIHKDRPELPDIDVDSEGARRPLILDAIKEAAMEVGGQAISVCTFGSEGTRSAILTAARGLGIDIDIAQYLTSMIPQERGFLWSLSDCVYGNEEKDRRKIKSVIDEFSKHKGLLETAMEIEGLVCRTGIHACGIVIFNESIHKRNALMRAPNGLEITQYDLGDTEYMGGIKFDLLSVEALDKIHATMDLLIEDGLMEWKGNLKSTYNAYLHPDVLDRDSIDMWKLLWDNKLIDAFQMDSSVGKQTLTLVKPRNIPELTAANSLMRLMPEGNIETPSETFTRYKNRIESWYEELRNARLTKSEIEVLTNEIGYTYGVANTQEEIMLLAMNPKIANFTIKDANKLRKAVAKKKADVLEETKELFYKKGREIGTSEPMLDYVWNIQIMKQAGYGFSIIHATAYSLIGLQELNLAYKFPQIYWTTACLSINSGATEIEDGAEKGTNYGKLSAAIGRTQADGVDIELPDINKAKFGFTADVENNAIMFGLKGISEINDEFAKKIVENRPYESIDDFINKCEPQRKQILNLIKAGSFDSLMKQDRRDIMMNYLMNTTPKKSRITLQNMGGLISYKLIPQDLSRYAKLYNFNKYIKDKEVPEGYALDERAYQYFTENFTDDIIIRKKHHIFLNKEKWEDLYKRQMEGIKEWMQSNQDMLIDKLQKGEVQELWDKYCPGNISQWEMEVLGFYYSGHELASVNPNGFTITKITDLPYEPEVIERRKVGPNKEIPIFKIHYIMGTVLDRTSYKHAVTLLTPEGVITIKSPNEQFGKYDKTISKVNPETKKKETVDPSWFKKGTKLVVAGYKSGDQFMARGRAKEGVFPFYKITGVDDFNTIITTRYRADD